MSNPFQFAETLRHFIDRSGFSVSQLARLTDIPHPSLVNWLDGRVKKPRYWDGLARLAAVLGLDEKGATALLQAAGHPSIADLLMRCEVEKERTLLLPWVDMVTRRQQAPFQAPADLPYFVGRTRLIHEIRRALQDGQLFSLHGMGGSGKTALATRVAYLMRPHFPDGVLWTRVSHSDPMSILSAFAAAYDKDVTQYTDMASRSQMVRMLLASKRALIVLDDVVGSHEVVPLIPPTGSCVVLITTRRHDLAVSWGTTRFVIGPFDKEGDESLQLFTQLLGHERVQRDRPILFDLAELVGHLPLAVAVVASRLAYEHGWSAAGLRQRLRGEASRLPLLAYEDQAVELSFKLSYEALIPEQREIFIATGAFRGDDFGVEAVASVAQYPFDVVHDHLRTLYGLSLLQAGGREDRYRLHPLLQDFARSKGLDKQAERQVVSYFLDFLRRHEKNNKALDLESGNLNAALRKAWSLGMKDEFVAGVELFFAHLFLRGHYEVLTNYLQQAQEAALAIADRTALARLWVYQGEMLEKRQSYIQAEAVGQKALQLAEEINDDLIQGMAQKLLGRLAFIAGNLVSAKQFFEGGLAAARRGKCLTQTAILFNDLGIVAIVNGRYEEARAYFNRGLNLVRGCIGFGEINALLLTNLGALFLRTGDLNEAEEVLQSGLAWGSACDLGLMSFMFFKLGTVKKERGIFNEAREMYHKGLELAERIEDKEKMGLLLAGLGDVYSCCGEAEMGEAHLLKALHLVQDRQFCLFTYIILGDHYLRWGTPQKAVLFFEKVLEAGFQDQLPAAQYGLARIAAAEQNWVKVRELGQQSMAGFQALGHYKVTEVETWLEEQQMKN